MYIVVHICITCSQYYEVISCVHCTRLPHWLLLACVTQRTGSHNVLWYKILGRESTGTSPARVVVSPPTRIILAMKRCFIVLAILQEDSQFAADYWHCTVEHTYIGLLQLHSYASHSVWVRIVNFTKYLYRYIVIAVFTVVFGINSTCNALI